MGRTIAASGHGAVAVIVMWLVVTALALGLMAPNSVAAQGMDLRQAAGVPLPAADLPAGTISVRVVRGSFANNLAGETVVFIVDGEERTATTDANGRAQVTGLPSGARVRATVTVDGERLESQEVVVGGAGIRFVLLASDEGASLTPAVPGSVLIGRDSRVLFDYANELLNVYYVLQVNNPTSAPVDLGGPLVIDLPAEARGATRMDGSTMQATVSGARVTVVGPFPPGRTDVNVAFTLPFHGDTARFEQQMPVPTEAFPVFTLKTRDMDMVSAQLVEKQVSVREGQEIVTALTPSLAAGDVLAIDITGLPHRPTWPRNLALGLAGTISIIGLWAAFGPGTRRHRA